MKALFGLLVIVLVTVLLTIAAAVYVAAFASLVVHLFHTFGA